MDRKCAWCDVNLDDENTIPKTEPQVVTYGICGTCFDRETERYLRQCGEEFDLGTGD